MSNCMLPIFVDGAKCWTTIEQLTAKLSFLPQRDSDNFCFSYNSQTQICLFKVKEMTDYYYRLLPINVYFNSFINDWSSFHGHDLRRQSHLRSLTLYLAEAVVASSLNLPVYDLTDEVKRRCYRHFCHSPLPYWDKRSDFMAFGTARTNL